MHSVSVHFPLREIVSVPPSGGCGYTVINFNTSAQTLRCVTSLLACQDPPEWIYVLDNASTIDQFETLQGGLGPAHQTEIRLFRSDINTGFARGSNLLIEQLMLVPGCKFIGLLNNDAIAMPLLVTELKKALSQQAGFDMAGARMHKLSDPKVVDTLGISLYRSLMPADRHEITDTYLGPTGGCALFTVAFLNEMLAICGYIFDDRFFCYCEDTDLVLRGCLFGRRAIFVDQLLALHEGQASSGKNTNNFIAYHGLRNVIWMHLKLLPASIVIRYFPWLLSAHLGTMSRYILTGRIRLLVKIWCDSMNLASELRNEHYRLSRQPNYSSERLLRVITRRFYRLGYLSSVMRGAMRKSPAIPPKDDRAKN